MLSEVVSGAAGGSEKSGVSRDKKKEK